jgi:hypothetical protein
MCRLLLCIFYMFIMMLIFAILCMFVLMQVDEQATEDPGVQQIEVAEEELIEGKLCPSSLLFTQSCSF